MTVLLAVLRVVCGIAAVATGGWVLVGFIRDTARSSIAFTVGAAVVLILFCLTLIGSGLFTIAGVGR